ncbi:MAG: hypothetical protein U0575_02425 [Phycisphaerales bacterium]
MVDALHGKRRHDGPRRIRNGVKLRRDPDALQPWPACAWRDALMAPIEPIARAAGLDYAKAGQTASLVILPPAPGADGDAGTASARPAGTPHVRIEASVQGRAPRPYAVVIEIDAWTRREWDAAIDAMAREAIYSAKLLAGEIPPAVEELCRTLGPALLPRADETFGFTCTCADAKPCKHHATAIYLLAERLVEHPMLAFNLRGMPHETALARLHEARSLHTHGRSTAHAASSSKAVARPFEACFADFWRPGPQLTEFEQAPATEHLSHALLRRLGPSPMQGRFPLVGLLASIYDSVRESAQRMRAEAESGRADSTPAADGFRAGDGSMSEQAGR